MCLKKSNLQSIATQILPKIRDERNVNDPNVQLCRLVVGDDSLMTSRIQTLTNRFFSAFTTSSSRKKRSGLISYILLNQIFLFYIL